MRWLIDSRRFTMLMLTLLIVGGGWIVASRDFNSRSTFTLSAAPQIGFAAPDFDLETLDGGRIKLADLRGKVVMVNLWASWCPPCRAEMPAIQHIYEQYRDRGLEVIAVNATYRDSEAEARSFLTSLGLTFPVALDRDGLTNQRYYVQLLPSTYFIARDGTIGDMLFGGPMTEALIVGKIEKLLAE